MDGTPKKLCENIHVQKKGTSEDIPTNRFESEMIATTRIANLQPRETRHGHQKIARLRRGGNMTSSILIYKSDMWHPRSDNAKCNKHIGQQKKEPVIDSWYTL